VFYYTNTGGGKREEWSNLFNFESGGHFWNLSASRFITQLNAEGTATTGEPGVRVCDLIVYV